MSTEPSLREPKNFFRQLPKIQRDIDALSELIESYCEEGRSALELREESRQTAEDILHPRSTNGTLHG